MLGFRGAILDFQGRPIARIDKALERRERALERAWLESEECFSLHRPGVLAAHKVHVPGAHASGLEGQAVAQLAGCQSHLGAIALGDVVDDAVQQHTAFLVVYAASLDLDVAQLTRGQAVLRSERRPKPTCHECQGLCDSCRRVRADMGDTQAEHLSAWVAIELTGSIIGLDEIARTGIHEQLDRRVVAKHLTEPSIAGVYPANRPRHAPGRDAGHCQTNAEDRQGAPDQHRHETGVGRQCRHMAARELRLLGCNCSVQQQLNTHNVLLAQRRVRVRDTGRVEPAPHRSLAERNARLEDVGLPDGHPPLQASPAYQLVRVVSTDHLQHGQVRAERERGRSVACQQTLVTGQQVASVAGFHFQQHVARVTGRLFNLLATILGSVRCDVVERRHIGKDALSGAQREHEREAEQ